MALFTRSVAPTTGTVARLGIVHGYGDHSGRYAEFMRWMAERGVACHAFDFRGHGRSSGRRGFVRAWSEHLDDLGAFLATEEMGSGGEGPVFLLGHSHGGLVVAVGGIRGVIPEHVRGVVLSAPYLRNRMRVPGYKLALNALANRVWPCLRVKTGIRGEWLSSDPEMCEERRGDELALRHATPRWFSTMGYAQREAMEGAGKFMLPMLMLIAGEDPIADPAAAEAFFERAGSKDKMVKRYPPMVHEILRERGREEAFEDVYQWISARVGAGHTPPSLE